MLKFRGGGGTCLNNSGDRLGLHKPHGCEQSSLSTVSCSSLGVYFECDIVIDLRRSRVTSTEHMLSSSVCVCVGVVQKNKKEVRRWEAYVSVTCTWLPECLYMLGLPIAICKDSLVTYSVCTCV